MVVDAVRFALVLFLAADGGPTDDFAARILSPAHRQMAACAAFKKGLAPDGGPSAEKWNDEEQCRVNHVIRSVGPQGQPVFLVFFAEEWSQDFARPGKPLGHFVVFDADGFVLPWFMNANVLEPEDSVVVMPSGQPVLVAQHLLQETDCHEKALTDQHPLRLVHVVSLADPQRPVLSLVAGPAGTQDSVPIKHLPDPPMECHGDVCSRRLSPRTELRLHFPWDWRVTQRGGEVRLNIGPVGASTKVAVGASYKWDAHAGRFEGPAGDAAHLFLRFDGMDPSVVERFAVLTGAMPADCPPKGKCWPEPVDDAASLPPIKPERRQ